MDPYEDEITGFLLEKENFLLALDIEKHFEKAKDQLHRQLWEKLCANVEGRLPEESWSVELDEFSGESSVARGYFGMSILPPDQTAQFYLMFRVEQHAGPTYLPLYGGVTWTEVPGISAAGNLISSFQSQLKEDGFTRSNEKWPGWRYIRGLSSRNDFLREYIERGDDLIEEIIGQLGMMVERHSAELIKTNKYIQERI
ncbi:unnamed protein product [marine sediment metagenome]|uniref:Uncharacterized protein n=1 Tax=marine sediment metagenome TaxID=412755 RepID=X1T710_9ZZZZ